MPGSNKEAIHRANNLLMVILFCIMTAGTISVFINESGLLDKADDVFFIFLGVITLVWYLPGRNRYHYHWLPFVLSALGFIDKAGSLVFEVNDRAGAGDESALVIILAMIMILSALLMTQARKINEIENASYPARIPYHETGFPRDEGR